MRLLRSYCNRERQTAHLAKLRAQAVTGRVSRDRSSIPACTPAPKRLSAEANAAIIADYAAKMPVRAIARKHGVNEGTVHHRLKRAGVTKRPYAIQPNTIEEILRLHAKGRTNVAIAHSVGVSESSVHNVLKKHAS
uniref:helix-turn-helix domain-containing protein n=1 Tax=Microbacterium sp. SORGH_AS_1204 TaxID=3041785 RepID=UPI0035934D6E